MTFRFTRTLAIVLASGLLSGAAIGQPGDARAAGPGSELTISLITMGNGSYVWEFFGHNALWIHDARAGTDRVYNWGVFSFDAPGFIPRFLQGTMMYRVDTLFVGPGDRCLAAMASPAFTSGRDYRPIGFIDSHLAPLPGALGQIGDFSLLLAASGAQVVVVCGYVTDKEFQGIVDTALAAGCQVLSVPRTVDIAGVHPTTVWRRGQPLVQLTAPSLKGWQLAVKRVVDVIGAAVGLMLASPVMAAIAMLIKIDSPGLVLFSQERVGFGGQRFRMLKFRTMKDGADAEKHTLAHLNHTGDARLFKIPNDPRVTRLGAALRRWSLDELPQLWNVLVGDMSLVGPRPFFEADLAEYRDHHFRRLGAKPGITGLWQVKGRSSVTDFEEVVRLDRDYVERWSLWLDVEILVLTLPAVIRRTGAF